MKITVRQDALLMAKGFIIYYLFIATWFITDEASCNNLTTVELTFEIKTYNPKIGEMNVKYSHQENGIRRVLFYASGGSGLNIFFRPEDIFYTLSKGEVLTLHYLLTPSNYVRDLDNARFLLLYSYNDSNAIHQIKKDIKLFPDGSFLKPCKHNDGRYLEGNTLEKVDSLEFNFHHLGPTTAYVTNISCEPMLKSFHHSGIRKIVKDGETMTQRFPKPCTGALGVDYQGVCTIDVSYMCQNSSLVKRIVFTYGEGDVEECADRNNLGQLTNNGQHDVFLYSDELMLVLTIVCGILIKTILSTIIYKWINLCKSCGMSKATKQMCRELSNAFQCHDDSESQALINYHVIKPNWKF